MSITSALWQDSGKQLTGANRIFSRNNCVHWAGQYPVHMKSITYTAARENLATTINRVCEDNAPVMITRNRDQSVVMLSLAEYESLEETAHLLRSPANAKRLLRSIDQLERGKGVRKKLKLGT
ncbi:MAG: type II toxin-antitoxin system prevent-host-death family antitoxin [Candidatus Udaeobacter sp.]